MRHRVPRRAIGSRPQNPCRRSTNLKETFPMSRFECFSRLGRLLLVAILMLVILIPQSVGVFADDRRDDDDRKGGDDRDRVILSFSTVGDSRQDPVSPDKSTVP